MRFLTLQDDIFEYDLLFFPIHDAEHWSLICVDITQKKVIGYDSVGKDLTSYVQVILLRYILFW